ncbi:MAG: histidine kinase [Bacteroidia bacterium]|nr:histidine kinase [Bacteroidia bacterium]
MEIVKPAYGWKFRMAVLSASLLWASFHFWLVNRWFGYSVEVSLIESFDATFFMVGASFIGTFIAQYIPQSSRVQAVVLLGFILTYCCHYIVQESLISLASEDSEYLIFINQSAPVRIGIYFLVIAGSGVAMIFYSRISEQQLMAKRESATTHMVREAELQKLQLQLQPHFLFNSLNSMNALIMVDPAKARDMVQQLSDFLRATLKRADEQWITLDQEFVYLQLYLAIEKVRFGHRLEVQAECDDQIKLWLIPPLLIQPLVENAIKFGLYGTTDSVLISLKTERIDNLLQIEISNPFDSDMQPAEGSGFGLNGLRRRLYLLYARNDLLKTTIVNNRFTVQLTLPEKV